MPNASNYANSIRKRKKSTGTTYGDSGVGGGDNTQGAIGGGSQGPGVGFSSKGSSSSAVGGGSASA